MTGFPADIRESLTALLPKLRRFARTLTRHEADADDLVQIALERALVRHTQWQPDTRLDSWMYTIIRNAWIDEVRQRKRRGQHLDINDMADAVPDAAQGSAADLVSVQDALALLPEEQRTAVSLVLIEGLSYKEAAEVMQVPIGTLTSRLARGRDVLQRLLQPMQPPEQENLQ
jgi:RNA polymerase sigma-70 factor, ECF subfamily